MATTAPRLWVVERRRLWGDYGTTLISGYAERRADGGPLYLNRAGPFLPPISFPWITDRGGWGVIVSPDLRRRFESLGLGDVSFRDAVKDAIVPVAWETWDHSARLPPTLPPDGEPEGYVMGKRNRRSTAAKMPQPAELLAPVGVVKMHRAKRPGGLYADEFVLDAEPADVPDVSRDHPDGYLVVTDRVRVWLADAAGEWVRFLPVWPATPDDAPASI